jgi:hypothetical protein
MEKILQHLPKICMFKIFLLIFQMICAVLILKLTQQHTDKLLAQANGMNLKPAMPAPSLTGAAIEKRAMLYPA